MARMRKVKLKYLAWVLLSVLSIYSMTNPLTCDFAVISNAYAANSIISGSSHFASAPCAMAADMNDRAKERERFKLSG